MLDCICTESTNCYHGLEGFHIRCNYKFEPIPNTKFVKLYTEVFPGNWHFAQTCSIKTFNKFFEAI